MYLALEPEPRFLFLVEITEELTFSMHFHSMKAIKNEMKSPFDMFEQSTVREKMATGTFTYNALRTKTLKERMKTQEKLQVIQSQQE